MASLALALVAGCIPVDPIKEPIVITYEERTYEDGWVLCRNGNVHIRTDDLGLFPQQFTNFTWNQVERMNLLGEAVEIRRVLECTPISDN